MNLKNDLKASHFSRLSLNSKNIEGGSICSSTNMLVTENGIISRFGMRLLDDPIVFNPWEFSDGYTEFNITDLYINIADKKGRIAVSREDDGYSNINYHICALFSDGKRRDLGCISFTRADHNTFGVPSSYVIYSGKPTTGSGIYFLAHIVYGNFPDSYVVYELSKDMSDWQFLNGSHFYTPTILMNGHGDSAAQALISRDIELSSPLRLEALNMLSGCFHSYYTTDGYSYSFSLPVSPLMESQISCRLDINSDSFIDFYIGPNEDISASASVNGNLIRIRCERSIGRIFFETDEGALYCPQFYGKENNLRFTAEKASEKSALKVCSMSRMSTTTAPVSKGSGSVTLFSGSSLYPNELIWIDPENPLYFPESCSLTVSQPSGPVNHTVALGGRFFIFKNDTIFSAKVLAATPYDLNGILNGISNSGKIAYPTVSLDSQRSLPAPFLSNTLQILKDSIFFCCKNRSIYKVNSSLTLTPCLEALALEPQLSAVYDNKYIVLGGKDGYVYDPETSDRHGLYHWNFPISFLASLTSEGDTLLFADNGEGIIYSFALDGEEDCYLSFSNTPLMRQPIRSSLRIKITESDRINRLLAIAIGADTAKPFEFRAICDGSPSDVVWLNENKSLIKRPVLYKDLSAEFVFSGKARLTDIGLKYAKLKRI